jgi:hypothetical protein
MGPSTKKKNTSFMIIVLKNYSTTGKFDKTKIQLDWVNE